MANNQSPIYRVGHQIGLYVHWPYCARICPYCDFNVYKNKPDAEEALVAAILIDLDYWRALSGSRTLVSIHFGGGTPSLLAPKYMNEIIIKARQLWQAEETLEIGLEANPKDIYVSTLKGWADAGVERLSIGVQSFDDASLKFLGRDHDGEMAKTALDLAVSHMPRVSADLIYGWHGQSGMLLQLDLDTAINSGASHISAYQLTIEEGTAFGRAELRKQQKAVKADASADLFEQVVRTMSEAGYGQYEVSNFAKIEAAQSRHNLLYWQGVDYIGVGPGAHGRLTIGDNLSKQGERIATIAARKPNAYIQHVRVHDNGIHVREILTPNDWAQEYVLMGLRIRQGISRARYTEICGEDLPADKIRGYVRAGLLWENDNGDRLAATQKGRMVLDTLSHELLS